MPRSEDGVLTGSPGVREEGGERLPEEAEEVGQVFCSAAGGPEVSLERFGMGEEGKVGEEEKRKQSSCGIKATGRPTCRGFPGLALLKRIGPFSLLVGGGLAAWTLGMEFWFQFWHVVWHALAE